MILFSIGGWKYHKHMVERGNRPRFSIEDRLRQYEPTAGVRLKDRFDAAGVSYPPARLTLVGLKEEKKLQVYAPASDGHMQLVYEYPILAASGHAGPKLQEGDGQVPEGLYKIESLNPNSLYHLALRVGYPNEWDIDHAAKDGRKDLGGDIMIHGAAGSIGCLAMGDPASEEIFILAARTGIENIQLILSPVDFRVRDLPSRLSPGPGWTNELYSAVRLELGKLPRGDK